MSKVLLLILVMFLSEMVARAQPVRISVIRPKYFVKKSRLELGADLSAVMNQTFTYTYLLSAGLAYHFTDSFALGVAGSYGVSANKADRTLLSEDFKINIDIFDVLYLTDASLLWTPVYGKYQLSSGRLVYFDTYVTVGGGLMGIKVKKKPADKEIDKEIVEEYPCYSALAGIGQRFYLDKKTSFRWQIKNHVIFYNNPKKVCQPSDVELEGKQSFGLHHTLLVQAGFSYFL